MSKELVALVTCPQNKAEQLASTLVERKVAACVNIIEKVISVYRWEGNIEKDQESLLVAKTNTITWDDFEASVKELHPYDVPEIISFDIEKGNSAYLEWLNNSLVRN